MMWLGLAPIARAAVTNSRSANTNAVERASRLTGAIDKMPSVMAIVHTLRSSSDVIKIASTNAGNDNSTSMANELMRSNQPFTKPPIRPIVPPIKKPKATATKPINNDTRPPRITRAKISRASRSVPNQCSADGA